MRAVPPLGRWSWSVLESQLSRNPILKKTKQTNNNNKQTEKAVESKPVLSLPLWSQLQFLYPGSCLEFLTLFLGC